jgi:hypothetical protein
MNNEKLKAKADKLEAEVREKLGDEAVNRILSELQDEEFAEYIRSLELKDMQGRVLMLGDNVSAVHGHFDSGEIIGVVDYRDGYGIEFVVRVGQNELRNVGSEALQFINRK